MIVRIYTLHDPRDPLKIRYVGQTHKPLNIRLSEHISEAKTKAGTSHRCNWIFSLLKDGLKPVHNLIEETDLFNFEAREMFWISYYRSIGCKLVNATDGGEGVIGYRFTKEMKEHLSKSKKWKKAWNAGLKTSGMSGRKHSIETKIKMAAAKKGRVFSEEHRKNLSLSHLGHPASPKSIAYLKNHTPWNKGKKLVRPMPSAPPPPTQSAIQTPPTPVVTPPQS